MMLVIGVLVACGGGSPEWEAMLEFRIAELEDRVSAQESREAARDAKHEEALAQIDAMEDKIAAMREEAQENLVTSIVVSVMAAQLSVVGSTSFDADADDDGIPDFIDPRPLEPSTLRQDADLLTADADGDEVPDFLDLCPDEPGHLKLRGCPPQ